MKDEHLPEAIRESSVIMIGQVSSVEATKRVADTVEEKKWTLRLVRASATVETVLKGDVDQRIVTFYYFYPEYAFSLPSINLISSNDRVILFLKRDQNVYRSVNDVYASCIHIATGSHPELHVGPHKTIEQAITEACILPGPHGDLDRQQWPLWIEQGASVGHRLIGKAKTLELLDSLRGYPDYRVRTEACLARARLSANEDLCVERLQNHIGADRSFGAHVRLELFNLQMRRHYELGTPPPTRLPQPALPGTPAVEVQMKEVRVWWPW